VSGNTDWMLIGPIGSRNGFTTVFREQSGIAVVCGCFYGALDEFESKVKKVHGGNKDGRAYRAMIEMVRSRFD
jgi:hypothetical protein